MCSSDLRSGVLVPERPLRVLDVGAGPLTASIALALSTRQPLDVVAFDRSEAILADGVAVLRALRPEVKVRTVVGNVRHGRDWQAVGGPFDLVLASHVLNEWSVGGAKSQSAAEFVAQMLEQRLAPHGSVVLVEPGTRDGSRRLIEVREHLGAVLPELAILSPCLGPGPCPLAGDGRDWCHGERPWQRPEVVQALDAAIGHARPPRNFSCRRAFEALFGKDRPCGLKQTFFLQFAAGGSGRSLGRRGEGHGLLL